MEDAGFVAKTALSTAEGEATPPAAAASAAPPPTPERPTAPAGPPAQKTVTTRELVGFLCMVLGMFMAILDIQIVSSSLSNIQAGLAASPDEASWVQTAYLIAEVVMIPLSGFLSRLLSTRVLFVTASAGFTLMSAGCAIAWNLDSMIIFRALQGFIGGGMIPTVFAASFMIFPPARRAGVSVMMGLVATMAPTLGPTLGGFLTAALSWHWLFLINIIPGIIVTFAVYVLVDIDKPDRSLWKGFDTFGLLSMAVFLGSLEYMLEEGPRKGWFGDEAIVFSAVTTLAGCGAFFWRVLSYRQPIVDLRAFTNRNFALGCLFSFVLGIGLYGSVYLVPAFLARVRGYNSLQIGLTVIVTGCCQFLSAPIAGALSKKMDLRLMLGIGLALFGGGVYWTSILTADTGFWQLFFPQAMRGVSLMLCFLPINTLALGTLAPDKLKNASGLYNLTRNLGGAIGLAAIGTVLTDRLQLHWARIGESVNLARPVVQGRIDAMTDHLTDRVTGDPALAAMKQIGDIVYREATIMSFSDAFILMAGAFVLALCLMPLVEKPRAMKPAADGGH